MSIERPIEDWLGELPEPERTEALEARRKAVEMGSGFAAYKTAVTMADAIGNGFSWEHDGGSGGKWSDIFCRAEAGEFDGPSEVDRLRARVAELEGALVNIQEYWNRDQNEAAMSNALWHIIETANNALNKK